jgi:hypothetical protein
MILIIVIAEKEGKDTLREEDAVEIDRIETLEENADVVRAHSYH